jgi:prefoldin beta subunit
MDIPKDAQEKIQRMQIIEQNLQQLLMQKQQFQSQLFELESALKELEGTKQAYKIVGNIMVAAEKEDLKKDVLQKKEIAELRVSSIEKQEQQLKDRAKKLQEEILSTIKSKEK